MTVVLQLPQRSILIETPTAHVWDLLATQFHRVADWSSDVDRSEALDVAVVAPGAPMAGRICYSSTPGFREVTERIVAYDEAHHMLAYEASGIPKWAGIVRNTWTVEEASASQCRVSFQPTADVGPLGWVLTKLVMLLVGDRLAMGTLRDFKRFAENVEAN